MPPRDSFPPSFQRGERDARRGRVRVLQIPPPSAAALRAAAATSPAEAVEESHWCDTLAMALPRHFAYLSFTHDFQNAFRQVICAIVSKVTYFAFTR